MPRSGCLLLLVFALFGCPEERARGGSRSDASQTSDGGPFDAGADPRDAGDLDGGAPDGARIDAGAARDAGPLDSGDSDGGLDDGGAPDSGAPDAGPPDTGAVDAGPPPVTCNEPGLVTRTISDSASSGTPDTYFFDVNPGDPFCAQISGGGSGRWGVTVSNGTSSGIYCSDTTPCRVRVATGDPTLLVTAQTTDIGSYTLTVQYIPR